MPSFDRPPQNAGDGNLISYISRKWEAQPVISIHLHQRPDIHRLVLNRRLFSGDWHSMYMNETAIGDGTGSISVTKFARLMYWTVCLCDWLTLLCYCHIDKLFAFIRSGFSCSNMIPGYTTHPRMRNWSCSIYSPPPPCKKKGGFLKSPPAFRSASSI